MGEYEGKCGCKGIRSCLICEQRQLPHSVMDVTTIKQEWYRYCWRCDEAYGPMEDFTNPPSMPPSCAHAGSRLKFPGVVVVPEFLSEQEEANLVRSMDTSPWKPSQSGRIKQDYGPKVNFKRKKVKQASFTGLPSFIKPFVDRMNSHDALKDFVPVEQCNLDYRPDRGSAIDPHVDDSWLWGERLVTVNLLSGTYLDMTPVAAPDPHTVMGVRVPLPPRSLLVLSGPARHQWHHGIQRGAIVARRIAVTLRELADEFLEGGAQEGVGREVLSVAGTFAGAVVP